MQGSLVSLSHLCGSSRRFGMPLIACILLALPTTCGCTQIAGPVNAAKCILCQGSGKCHCCNGDGFGLFGLPCGCCQKTGKCTNCNGWGFGGKQ